MVLEAKVYPQRMQLPAVWNAQKRHIKRLGSKTKAIIRDNEYLFLILHPKAVLSTHAVSGFSCEPLHLETSSNTAKISTCAARNILTACFNQDILSYGHLFELLKTVIVTTNHVVLGQDVGSRLSDTAANFERSPSPEDKLREARVQLYQYLKAIATEDTPTFIDCCPQLRKWDSTDAEYRGLLHEFGRVRPYELEMERIRQSCGSTTHIESLECFRQARWEEFIASLALGPSHLTTCAFTSILEPSKQLRLELPKPSTMEESNHEHAPFVLSKTEKQRAKRQRRREIAKAQIRDD
ncbi:hypothetical protein CCUS01_08893 [Colletotrichum cuscutae]|uniref:Uncharacterized protein n=1 Tax=Colletotrichum cuscutae TaxID=1209917 RepID=A0AAI9UR50_9PEZI|nr:hypothetical protein CCUS01_08893 [Colletotrichum cuscutae]